MMDNGKRTIRVQPETIDSEKKSRALQSVPETERTHRLRARRIRVADLKLGSISASARHASLGLFQAGVEDLSLHGMALVLSNGVAQSSLVLSGDRLEQLTLRCDGVSLYDGTAIVRRLFERDADLIIGVELESNAVDLGELHRREMRDGFAERWRALNESAQRPQVSAEFKAWVADLHAYLHAARAFLQSEEQALQSADLLTRQETIGQYVEEASSSLVGVMNQAVVDVTGLVKDLTEEQHEIHRAYFRSQLLPFFRESPFMRRCYDKPLGYAGDYEMMNMMYRSPAEGETLFGKVLNMYAVRERAALAVMNRLVFLGNKIREAVSRKDGRRVRLASIGCGPAREIEELLRTSPEIGSRIDLALIDQDERAISFCERTLASAAKQTDARIQFIREPIRKLMVARRLSETLGERDLIYSAGLFDYLGDRAFAGLMTVLYEGLASGGQLLIGNFATGNPSRPSMEYFADWFLLHRSAEELRQFAAPLRPTPSSVDVEAEPLGVNLFLSIIK